MKRSRRLKKIRRTILALLCILFLALVCFSGWKVYSIVSGYKTAERRYDSLAGAAVSAAVPTKEEASELSPAASAPPEEAAAEEQPHNEARPQELSPVSVDFEVLNRYGGRVIGWLYLPGTVINYPVAQSGDNEYYLERFLDGSPIAGGTLFADYLCPSDFSGRNTIIYGHNMKDGSMFALIDDYGDPGFFHAHPVMYLNTPDRNYRLDLCRRFAPDPQSFVYSTAFSSDEDYASFLRSLLDCSEIDCRIEPSPESRIVTVSTCTDSGEDVRFVVCGTLTEIG